jgi:hypothetical protein
MKLFYLPLVSWFLLSSAIAAVVDLPKGGKVKIDSKEWNVQDTKALTGVSTLIFLHRGKKDLRGILMDGSVREEGQCGGKVETVCERRADLGAKLSVQLIKQRVLKDNVFQNYVLAFNFPKEKEAEFAPILKKLKADLEQKP